MIKANLMNILLVTVGVMAVLVGYNAFVATSDDGHTATDHVSEYLALATVKPAASDDPALAGLSVDDAKTIVGEVKDKVQTNDSSTTPESKTDAESQPQTAPETTAPVTEVTPKPISSTPQAGDKPEVVYTVVEGDTYGCIAEKYYGSFEHWVDVVAVNPVNTVGFTEYGLFVGAKIVLPAVAQTSLKPVSNLCG